ncbi:MAG: hypothetical protein R3236_03245, partial [Phycisphaeraceae bacterium]|nr:hypothetical protein [Phycisphaeraceae bacterium]
MGDHWLSTAFLIVGILFCAFVGLQLFMMFASTLRQTASQHAVADLELELLKEQVAAARAAKKRAVDRTEHAWNGYRKFHIAQRVGEVKDVTSIYLEAHDGKSLPAFRPGQFLTFRLRIPGQDKPVVRCYSLSDRPRADRYRVTVKKVPP